MTDPIAGATLDAYTVIVDGVEPSLWTLLTAISDPGVSKKLGNRRIS
jgi:hypothetical protein